MLDVGYAERHKYAHYTECRYAECHYAHCHGAVLELFLKSNLAIKLVIFKIEH
jgi:hypothetical protein